MKLVDILQEAPSMVDHTAYDKLMQPTTNDRLAAVTRNIDKLTTDKKLHGTISIRSSSDHRDIFLVDNEIAVGIMTTTDNHSATKAINMPMKQVLNVFIEKSYRNQKLGKSLYDFVLHQLRWGFASSAAMTPDSRRIYGSYLKDSKVTVYAMDRTNTKHDLHLGPEGITTGDAKLDNASTFIMIGK